MNEERLLRLADRLESVPDERFVYYNWADRNTYTRNSCGTSGCALGHAVSIDEFAEAGLRMCDGVPFYGGFLGFGAAMLFFDIMMHEAHTLFSPSTSGLGNNATPKQVASHIRKFVDSQ